MEIKRDEVQPYVDPEPTVFQVSKKELDLFQQESVGTGVIVQEVPVGRDCTFTNSYGTQKVLPENIVMSLSKDNPLLDPSVIRKLQADVRERDLWSTPSRYRHTTR